MPAPKIQFLKGVGPKRAALLAELGVETPAGLLSYYPRTWQDRRLPGDSEKGTLLEEILVFRGKVLSAREVRTSKALTIFKAVLSNGKYEVEASWFKRFSWRYDVFASLRKEVREGAEIWIVGRPEDALFPGRIRVEEHYSAGPAAEAAHVGRIVPVYPLTEGLSGRFMREALLSALAEHGGAGPECLPDGLRARRALTSAAQAERGIHFPRSLFELEAARKRLAYEELFLLALAWGIKRRQLRAVEKEYRCELKRHLLTPFKEALAFEFTPSQKKVINEIFDDMLSPRPMARLLQGDVGSGKTVVALSALLLTAENGRQGLFMAPTEILAEQHALTFGRLLRGLPVRWALLTSSVKGPARRKILEDAAEGRLDILIGTHALIEEGVKLKNPGLVVVDEQHRFGVRQRAALRAKGDRTDALIMTA
ncbi:MAG TPA: DEAD/DEAH box helicase, partial [Elusimicrobiales bacterium]|nr:DEAD/DEAH box helicase [Elusimicrobiales bacterium]